MRQPVPFGKYLLLDRISVGGMAEVFKAKSYGVEGFEKVIAIKRILPSMGEDRDFIKMFIDEAKIAGQLSHANICQIFELGRIDGAHFIAMEFIWGKDLLQIQNRFRKLKQTMQVQMACYVISKVCEGLHHAHRAKDRLGRPLEIVHRDCSPQNVLVSYEGEVKIIDFGIARAASRSSRTNAGVLKGKFGYMSPEQVRGLPLDHRSDIFAVGTMLYESLTGQRLFLGESDFSTLEKVRNADVAPPRELNADIPAEVDAIVMKALRRDAKERYQWCSEMHADLQQFLTGQTSPFTNKTLGDWLKQAFSKELSREKELIEEYKRAGREGLIAGKPQAEAKLDVVATLGEAAPLEGDPTVLGGPDFDDVIQGTPPPGEISGEPPPSNGEARHLIVPAPRGKSGAAPEDEEDFENGPTEIFGEIAGADSAQRPMMREDGTPAKIILSESARHQGGAMASEAVGAQSGGFPAPGYGVGLHSQVRRSLQPGRPYALDPAAASYSNGGAPPEAAWQGRDESMYLPTASVPSLPPPMPQIQPVVRKPSLVKDIMIGVGIAAVVLGLFAAGKYFLFGAGPGPRAGKASTTATGTIALAVGGSGSARVFLNGVERAKLDGDSLTLTVDAGDYQLKVIRGDLPPCDRKLTVDAREVEVVNCPFTDPPIRGQLVLEGIAPDHIVFVDDEEISREAASEPIPFEPGTSHDIIVKQGDQVVLQLDDIVVESGKVLRKSVGESPGTAAAGSGGPVGYLLVDTTPPARVMVDGKDTGLTTPIAAADKLSLTPGKHKVTFVVGDKTFDEEVTIKAGKDEQLNKTLK